ncbi:DUF4274 domain-containing protein [Paenibacillus uliginis]
MEVSKSKDAQIAASAAKVLDINARDERGRTPLMLFLTNKMPPDAIKVLLMNGADLEAEDKLGDTALKKAVKFKQTEALKLLLEYGAKLDSPLGILGTAWNSARSDKSMADLLLETEGAIRLTLTKAEQERVDDLLYEESKKKAYDKIRQLDSPVLLHAVVNGYNWDDGPESMMAVFENPVCAEITLLDMYDLMDGDYWLEEDESNLDDLDEGKRFRELASKLKEKLARSKN